MLTIISLFSQKCSEVKKKKKKASLDIESGFKLALPLSSYVITSQLFRDLVPQLQKLGCCKPCGLLSINNGTG